MLQWSLLLKFQASFGKEIFNHGLVIRWSYLVLLWWQFSPFGSFFHYRWITNITKHHSFALFVILHLISTLWSYKYVWHVGQYTRSIAKRWCLIGLNGFSWYGCQGYFWNSCQSSKTDQDWPQSRYLISQAYTRAKSFFHFNLIILNQYLIILYFLVGGQHFSTFHSSHIACCYSNFSCTDRMERVGLYPKSIRWSSIFDVLYSGILHSLHNCEIFSKRFL